MSVLHLPACKRTVRAFLQRQYAVQTSTHCSEMGGHAPRTGQRKMGSKASDISGLVPLVLSAMDTLLNFWRLEVS